MKIQNSDFAAFIMSYERPEVLMKTLKRIEEQTYPPSFILIIDNSESDRVQTKIKSLKREEIKYYRVGYNSGPAGAANIGLDKLFKMGYRWIYWGDDDNPPRDQYEFEQLFKKLESLLKMDTKIGAISGKGGNLSLKTGRIRSLSNKELEMAPVVEVDSVPGGHTLIVNANLVKEGVLPDKKLFFGFEELDFSLLARSKGFKLFVDSENWLQIRKRAKHYDPKFRPRASGFGNLSLLQREYYSTRNLLFIFFKNRYYQAFAFTLIKTLIKTGYGFRYGLIYGLANFRLQWKALYHFFLSRSGKE